MNKYRQQIQVTPARHISPPYSKDREVVAVVRRALDRVTLHISNVRCCLRKSGTKLYSGLNINVMMAHTGGGGKAPCVLSLNRDELWPLQHRQAFLTRELWVDPDAGLSRSTETEISSLTRSIDPQSATVLRYRGSYLYRQKNNL
jgi:hypothetical protein